jgi:hypothetical protein
MYPVTSGDLNRITGPATVSRFGGALPMRYAHTMCSAVASNSPDLRPRAATATKILAVTRRFTGPKGLSTSTFSSLRSRGSRPVRRFCLSRFFAVVSGFAVANWSQARLSEGRFRLGFSSRS